MTSQKPDPALLDRFAAIVGDRYALRQPDEIEPYVIENRDLFPGASPLVLMPASTSEVAAILKLATETRTPVVPQGGNTGHAAGQVPDGSGRQIVLSLSRMNKIRHVDKDGATMTVEAGVILQTIRDAADDAGLMFPLTLASQGSCQIGGNLSSNAGGTTALAYGTARDLCLGVEVVLPTGEILDDLRKLKKDNTGYDLMNLFIGAEGTLGVITAAVLKLFPKPAGKLVTWIGLDSPVAALKLLQSASARAGSSLTTFELVRSIALEFTMAHVTGAKPPLAGNHPWYVMMEISSPRSLEDARATAEEILSEALEDGTISDAALPESIAQHDQFWNLRETMPGAQKPEGASIKHDMSVPVHAIPQFIAEADEAVLKLMPDARLVCFGHMGDGNLHYNITRPEKGSDETFLARTGEINTAVHAVVRKLDGSISAEHGIGQIKRNEFLATAPPVAIDLMRRIKREFDPANIMNPGKVV